MKISLLKLLKFMSSETDQSFVCVCVYVHACVWMYVCVVNHIESPLSFPAGTLIPCKVYICED